MPEARYLVGALLLAAVAACSNPADLTDPTVVAAELRGTWARDFAIPGMSTVFVISVQDLTVSGTGTFAGEAGPSGTLILSGQVTPQQIGGPLVHIDFTQSNGIVGHFSGSLSDTNSLSGSLWYASDPVVATFRRK
jgi:hypothetical protein